MKKIGCFIVSFLFCCGILGVFASASSLTEDADGNGIPDALESAINNSPEISSIVEDANNGVEISADRLLEALRRIDGINVDQLLQGLQGLDAEDGLLGRLSSLLGPDSNGLSGILSQIGGNLPSAGANGIGDISSGSISGLLSGLFNRDSSGAQSTETPTVHTTAAAYTQSAASASVYTPSYNYSGAANTYSSAGAYGQGAVNYSQYTVPYVAATTTPVEVTTQAYTVPETAALQPIAVAAPVSAQPEAQVAKRGTSWKKVVGAVLVFGAFGGVAAVIIKKSM